IFDKNGTSLRGPFDNNTLWDGFGGPCQTSNDGDPVALYDPLADRWMLSQFAIPTGAPLMCNTPTPTYQCIAVSTSGDPTSSYYRYAYQLSTDTFYDYPKFGAWPDGYYMSSNKCGPVNNGPSAIAFDRAKMLVGDPNAGLQEVQRNIWPINPVDLDG